MLRGAGQGEGGVAATGEAVQVYGPGSPRACDGS